MARDTLPSTLQPPVIGSAADKIGLPPSFATSHDLRRFDGNHDRSRNLGPPRTDYPPHLSAYDRRPSFPTQLPQIDHSQSHEAHRPQRPSHALSISSLLSSEDDDTPQYIKHRQVLPSSARLESHLRIGPTPNSLLRNGGTLVGEPCTRAFATAEHDYMARPPTAYYLPTNVREQQFQPQHAHYTHPFSERDKLGYSPASTAHTVAPSYYSSSSNTPPRRSVAPDYPRAPAMIMEHPPSLNYELIIRQQPVAARACGFGERDRRVIDPPPILELLITDKATGAPKQDFHGQFAMHCTLFSADGEKDETVEKAYQYDLPAARRLMGTLVASPYQAKDEYGVAGSFFVFADLSCRCPGLYKLHIKLLRLDPMASVVGTRHGTVATIETEAFSVYAAKDFPGMRASSALLRALREQGLNVGLKKGTEARVGTIRKRDRESSEQGESSGTDNDERRPRSGSGEPVSTENVGTKPKRKKARRRRIRAD